ncbi:unnamed protein product [Somion occarium]|uniref:DUF7770 domain-containing protein n=1 Tax=Somion occarium TaxID=3059160 RepID=A0ABP1D035_9APHY
MNPSPPPKAFATVFKELTATQPVIPGGISDTKSYHSIAVSDESAAAVVFEVIVVCSTSTQIIYSPQNMNGESGTSYHFRIFCVFDDDESVELQAFRISVTSGITNMMVLERHYRVTDKSVLSEHAMQCRKDQTFTVQQIIDHLIVVKKRHQYRFDRATGSGCRYWCNVVVKDLEDLGLLPEGSAAATEQWGNEVAEMDRASMNVPATQGTFYD